MDEFIPSSNEFTGTAVAPSPVIAGSQVQKETALRQATLPAAPTMGYSMRNKIFDAMALMRAGLQPGAGAQTKEYEAQRALRCFYTSCR